MLSVLRPALPEQTAFALVEQLSVVQRVLVPVPWMRVAPLLVLQLVAAMVADPFVEIPLPLLELVGKTWIYSCLSRALPILVLVMKRRDPSFFYLWMIYAHPLFFLIVISSPLQMSLFVVVQISSPYGTLTSDALSAAVFEIWSLILMKYPKRMNCHL